MEMIVQSITEMIKVAEFLCPHPKFFRYGNTFNLKVASLPKVLYFLRFLLLNNRTINHEDPPYLPFNFM